MRLSLLPFVVSPCCRAALQTAALGSLPQSTEDYIEEGSLCCQSCKRLFPIIGGVPRLVLEGAAPKVIKTRDSFSWEWSRYPGSLPEDEAVFLEETQLDRSDFKGRLVLDAGCGMGRYCVVALSLGAEVIALDLSESLRRLAAVAKDFPKLHVVQGDLLRPPFKERVFELAYSQGVLHHTSDTCAAFKEVAKLVKPGGLLSVWLYGKAGRFAEFQTNPLRREKGFVARHRRLAWAVVAVRHAVSDAIRCVTTRLPLALTYALCWPLAALGAAPGLKYLAFSVHRDFMVRVIENFDWISPPFQFHHTKEELGRWYEEAGFSVLKVLPHGLVPKPGILGRRRG